MQIYFLQNSDIIFNFKAFNVHFSNNLKFEVRFFSKKVSL